MNGPALLALQLIDSGLEQIEHRRKRLPERAAHADAVAAARAIAARLTALDARFAAAEATIEHAEAESASLTTHRTRLEGQLKTVIAPREAEALMHEIDTLSQRRGEQDDIELAALEEIAVADAERHQATAEQTEQAGVVTATEAALADADAALDAERDELAGRRPDALAALTNAEVDLYDRMRRQYHGVAVAQLTGATCQGCHLDLSRAELDALRALPADEPGECPQCNRLLVR